MSVFVCVCVCVCVRMREREREKDLSSVWEVFKFVWEKNFKLCDRKINFLVLWQIKFKIKFSLSWSTSSILGHFVTFWFILLKFVQLQDFGWNFLTTFGNFLTLLGNSCRLWHGSGGVILRNREISINYWFLRPYTHNLVKMQILQT